MQGVRIKKGLSLDHLVKNLLDLVLEREGLATIYEQFGALEPKLRKVPFEKFCEEFIPAKLAMGCVFWTTSCSMHGIEDKKFRNLFFKSTMDLFGTPTSIGPAARFSESLYASNADAEESPLVSLLVHFFKKLGLQAILKKSDKEPVLNEGFRFMMEVTEALKVVFEQRFDDFCDTHPDIKSRYQKEGSHES